MSHSEEVIENRGQVRPIQRHDLPVVSDMIARLGRLHGDAPIAGHRQLEADLFGTSPTVHGVVAQRFGFVVGYALLTERRHAQVNPRGLDLDQVFVMEGSRGLGLGKLLVDAALRHARGDAREVLIVDINGGSARVRDFYRALGFQPHGSEGRDFAMAL